jgi:DNA-binding response OmpR family regulator
MIVRAGKQRGLGSWDPPADYDDGRLLVRPRDYLAFADGEAVNFTMRELGLLVELYRGAGKIRSRVELRDAVWGEGTVAARSVDTGIARLRSKLDLVLPDLSYVHSYHGAGYDFFQDDAYEDGAPPG